LKKKYKYKFLNKKNSLYKKMAEEKKGDILNINVNNEENSARRSK
jgi:hypothetical protein